MGIAAERGGARCSGASQKRVPPCLGGHPTALASVPPSRSPVPHLVVHLLGAVEDVDHHADRPAQVLGGLCFSGACGAGGGPPHEEMEGLCQGDVAPAEGRCQG